jgi:hypothetical protein
MFNFQSMQILIEEAQELDSENGQWRELICSDFPRI